MDRYIQANRTLWDAWTLLHEYSQEYDLAGFRAGRCALKPIELGELGDVSGRRCSTFSVTSASTPLLGPAGAKVTGVDLSEEAIDIARSLSEELGIAAEFVRSDVYELLADP